MTRRKTSTSYEKSRLKELLLFMIQKHQPNCCLCGEQFKKDEILPSRGSDNLTEHHLDHNHNNNVLSNKQLCHRECHKRHHVKDNLLWKGMFK